MSSNTVQPNEEGTGSMGTRLAGKVALITGAGKGIGEGIARRFARENATVVVTDRDGASVERVAADLAETFGVRTSFRTTNVGYEDQVMEMVEWAADEHGRIDILVNNAQGFNGVAALEDKTTGEFEYSLRTGLYGTFWGMRAAFPYMVRQGGGSIVNLGSIDGIIGKPLTGDYDVAKEAVRGLTTVAAREWGQYQIRVNCLAPVSEKERRPGVSEALQAAVPLGRVGDCENDIGGVALFLASEDSRYVTGMTLFADGGFFLCPPRAEVVVDRSLPRPERKVHWVPEGKTSM